MRRAAALALPALLLLAAAPPTAQGLEGARRAREAALSGAREAAAEARARSAEADRLSAARVAAATELRATEDQVASNADRIAALRAEARQAAAAAEAQAARLAPLLPLAERLGLFPAETLLTVPAAPEQTVRGILVLQGLARRIRVDAEALVAQRARVVAMALELDCATQVQAEAAARQRAQAAGLDEQIAEAVRRRDVARDEAAQATRAAAAAAARSEDLRAAVEALAASRRAGKGRPAAEASGAEVAALEKPTGPGPVSGGWVVPVAGRVGRGFGAAGDAGPASGITFTTPAAARVVAPCGGRVVFAAPFRSYGQLVIIQCGADLHAVLGGLGRLDAAVGQEVRGGEPVGVMAAAGGALYVEIRRAGRAIDPSQYLRATS